MCEHPNLSHFHTDKRRDYFQCEQCHLVFVPPSQHLNADDEKAEYDKHQNELHDVGYLRFLSRVALPMLNKLELPHLAEQFGQLAQHEPNQPTPNDQRTPNNLAVDNSELVGLEFGCGPGPALATELQRLGLTIELYDLYYHNDPQKLSNQYDFVTCTEVVEHFNTPKKDIETLFALVKPDGVLGIMTKLVINQEKFSQWHYKNDQTHVAFFSQETFHFLAKKYGFDVEFEGNDVILLTKH